MTPVPAGPSKFTVTHSAPFEETLPAGVVEIDPGQMLSVISAEPAFAGKLELAVEMLNSNEDLLVRETAPPGAATRAQFRRIVARDDADARQALLDILRDNYGFELTPA